MDEMIVLYRDGSGMCIVRISEGKYYYGNGKNVNAVGVSPNQFLRFNPYFDYVEDKKEQPKEAVREWILKNVKTEG